MKREIKELLGADLERHGEAVAQFAEQESEQVRAYQREASTLLPFKQESDQP